MAGKVFLLPSGANQHSNLMGAIHYPNNGWQDIDTSVLISGGKNVVSKAWYDFTQLPTGIGFNYVSKTGGRVQVTLIEINDVSISGLGLNISPVRNRSNLDFIEVLPGFDIYFKCRPLGVEIFKRIKSESALNASYPKSLTWHIEEFSSGVIVNNTTTGTDNENNQSRVQLKQRYALEINNTKNVINSREYTLKEEFTGRIWSRNILTRVKEFLSKSNIAYPILIDQSTFNITADTDDGWESRDYGNWYDSGYPDELKITTDGGGRLPAWRWTGVTIAQAADVTLAELTVDVKTTNAATNITVLGGIDEDNTPTFTTGNLPSSRALTTSTIATGTVFGSTGDLTITVTGPVQEVIDRGSWASGNALALFGSTVLGAQAVVYDYAGGQAEAGRLAITVAAAGAPATPKKGKVFIF